MTTEGMNRREDSETAITLGEVYRLCERIEKRMSDLSDGIDKDVHALRGKLDAHTIAITLLKEKVDVLESQGRDWRGWIASGAIGAGLALMPFLFQWLAHR